MFLGLTVLSQRNCPKTILCNQDTFYLYSTDKVIGIANKFVESKMIKEQRNVLLRQRDLLLDVKSDLEYKASTLELSVSMMNKKNYYQEKIIYNQKSIMKECESKVVALKRQKGILIAITIILGIISIAK